MLTVDYKQKMGEMLIEQNNNKFKINIYKANCLAAFIYEHKNNEGKKERTLCNFLVNKGHVNNLMKNHDKLFQDWKVISVKLNLKYEESETLVKPMCQSGYKVICFYK